MKARGLEVAGRTKGMTWGETPFTHCSAPKSRIVSQFPLSCLKDDIAGRGDYHDIANSGA